MMHFQPKHGGPLNQINATLPSETRMSKEYSNSELLGNLESSNVTKTNDRLDEIRQYSVGLYRHLQKNLRSRRLSTRHSAMKEKEKKEESGSSKRRRVRRQTSKKRKKLPNLITALLKSNPSLNSLNLRKVNTKKPRKSTSQNNQRSFFLPNSGKTTPAFQNIDNNFLQSNFQDLLFVSDDDDIGVDPGLSDDAHVALNSLLNILDDPRIQQVLKEMNKDVNTSNQNDKTDTILLKASDQEKENEIQISSVETESDAELVDVLLLGSSQPAHNNMWDHSRGSQNLMGTLNVTMPTSHTTDCPCRNQVRQPVNSVITPKPLNTASASTTISTSSEPSLSTPLAQFPLDPILNKEVTSNSSSRTSNNRPLIISRSPGLTAPNKNLTLIMRNISTDVELSDIVPSVLALFPNTNSGEPVPIMVQANPGSASLPSSMTITLTFVPNPPEPISLQQKDDTTTSTASDDDYDYNDYEYDYISIEDDPIQKTEQDLSPEIKEDEVVVILVDPDGTETPISDLSELQDNQDVQHIIIVDPNGFDKNEVDVKSLRQTFNNKINLNSQVSTNAPISRSTRNLRKTKPFKKVNENSYTPRKSYTKSKFSSTTSTPLTQSTRFREPTSPRTQTIRRRRRKRIRLPERRNNLPSTEKSVERIVPVKRINRKNQVRNGLIAASGRRSLSRPRKENIRSRTWVRPIEKIPPFHDDPVLNMELPINRRHIVDDESISVPRNSKNIASTVERQRKQFSIPSKIDEIRREIEKKADLFSQIGFLRTRSAYQSDYDYL